jgi:hypothetical protein
VVVNLFSRLIDRAQFAQVEEKLTHEEQVPPQSSLRGFIRHQVNRHALISAC